MEGDGIEAQLFVAEAENVEARRPVGKDEFGVRFGVIRDKVLDVGNDVTKGRE